MRKISRIGTYKNQIERYKSESFDYIAGTPVGPYHPMQTDMLRKLIIGQNLDQSATFLKFTALRTGMANGCLSRKSRNWVDILFSY